MTTVKLSTWNIGSLYIDFENNINFFKEIITTQTYDILCMQEFPEDEKIIKEVSKWGNFSYCEFIKTSESHIHKGYNMGIAVFAKKALKCISTFQLPPPNIEIMYNEKREQWHSKFFTAITYRDENKSFIIVSGHGFPFHRYRLENPEYYDVIQPSFSALDNWIKDIHNNYPDINIYIAADFNIASPLLFMPFCRMNFIDAFEGKPTRPSGRKTDAILLPLNCDLLRVQNNKVANCHGNYIFDHNCISVEFDL